MQAIPEVLVGLIALILIVAAIGALYLARGAIRIIANALTGTLGYVPFIGSKIAHAITGLADPLMTWLGNQATGLQGTGVRFFQGMWKLNVTIANDLAGLAADAYAAILRVNNAQRALIGLAPSKPTQKGVVATGKAGRQTAVQLSQFEHRTNKRLATLEHDLGTVRRHGVPVKPGLTIHGLEARLNTVEHKIVEQRRWVRHQLLHPSKVEALAFFGVATKALSLNWLRCRGVGKAGRGVCGMNANYLEGLLAGALLLTGPISIVELAKACGGFVGDVEDGVRWFVREVK